MSTDETPQKEALPNAERSARGAEHPEAPAEAAAFFEAADAHDAAVCAADVARLTCETLARRIESVAVERDAAAADVARLSPELVADDQARSLERLGLDEDAQAPLSATHRARLDKSLAAARETHERASRDHKLLIEQLGRAKAKADTAKRRVAYTRAAARAALSACAVAVRRAAEESGTLSPALEHWATMLQPQGAPLKVLPSFEHAITRLNATTPADGSRSALRIARATELLEACLCDDETEHERLVSLAFAAHLRGGSLIPDEVVTHG